MAKTLIGNVKGKDGRGIASISKTGMTGSVDTYTIKYTDGTTSTYTVNNSDSVSLQRQIVPSAAVESSATASQAYAAGDYVVVNGVLRKVKSAIAKGNAISDSNSTATTVTGDIATLAESVSQASAVTNWVYLYGSKPSECVRYRRNGHMVELYWHYIQQTKLAWVAGNIPNPLRPSIGVAGPCMRNDSSGKPTNNVAVYEVRGNGDVRFTTLNDESNGTIGGYCCWPIG